MNLWHLPNKLKVALLRLCMMVLAFSLVLLALQAIEAIEVFAGVWKLKVACWAISVAVLVCMCWWIYVGIYRDGTFFLEDSDDD